MPEKLYGATVTFTYHVPIVVVAEDMDAALDMIWVAARQELEILQDSEEPLEVIKASRHVSALRDLPTGWDPDFYPYGDTDDHRTTRERLEKDNEDRTGRGV